MTRTPTHVEDLTPFATALHLIPTVEVVVEHNVAQLHSNGQPVATIKAVHTRSNAAKAPADDAGGLEAVTYLSKSARVMLTSNLWVDTVWSTGNCKPSAIALEIYLLLSRSALTVTLAPLFTTALCPSLLFITAGLHQEASAHICSFLSS